MNGWKVLTHDLRPPIQGGDPVDITQPLEAVLDRGPAKLWNP